MRAILLLVTDLSLIWPALNYTAGVQIAAERTPGCGLFGPSSIQELFGTKYKF